MTGRTIFISDIHMGRNDKTNWYQTKVHCKALRGFLRYVMTHAADINDVIVLGDWFDQWTYSPTDKPPDVKEILDKNKDVFVNQNGRSDNFVSVMGAIRGKLRYVNGNHDILIELKDINDWISSHHTELRVYPGTGSEITKPANENKFYRNQNGTIYAEHGHLYDLFNKPANMKENRYAPLPVGHFITRTVCDYVLKQLDPEHPNSAYLKDSGDPGYSNFGLDIKVIIREIENWLEKPVKPNIAEMVLGLVLSFDKKRKLDYTMEWYRGGCPSSYEVDDYYPGLVSIVHLREDLYETEVTLKGLDHFANKYLDEQKETRVMVMGHTHSYKLARLGRKKDQIYMNSGFYCAPIPNMEDKEKKLTFVEVIETENAGFTVNEKIVNYETGRVSQGQSATTP